MADAATDDVGVTERPDVGETDGDVVDEDTRDDDADVDGDDEVLGDVD